LLGLRRQPILATILLALISLGVGAVTFADERSRGLLTNTLQLAASALLVAAPTGSFLGFVLARTNIAGRRAAVLLLGAMLLVPLYLQAAAWQAGFGITGWQASAQSPGAVVPWLDGWRGAIWVHGCAGIPWVALFVGVAARAIPRSWEELALLEVSMPGVFCRVTLRLLLPAVLLGGLWVAITTMAEMSVTDLFGVRTYAEEIYVELNLGSWEAIMGVARVDEQPVPATAGMIITALGVGIALWVGRRLMIAPLSGIAKPPLVYALGRWRTVITVAAWFLVVVVVVVPLGNLVYKAGSYVAPTEAGFERGWSAAKLLEMTIGSPSEHRAEFTWSFAMAACTAFVTLLIVAPLAYACRTSRIAGFAALSLVVVGLATPGPLLGLGLITVFNSPSYPWLSYLYDRTIAVAVLAQVLRAMPLAFVLAWHALRTIPEAFVEAALLDGAGPVQRIWLAVRQRPTAIALAGLAAFVVSLGELAATILVVPPGIEPLSVRVFGLLHYNVEDQVAGISLMLILIHAAAGCVLLVAGRRVFRIG